MLSSQFCQVGNFSIHIALRNLRPPGTHSYWICKHYNTSINSTYTLFSLSATKQQPTTNWISLSLRLSPSGSKTRKIPYPTKNPFTWIFLLVSCPNYTYEVSLGPLGTDLGSASPPLIPTLTIIGGKCKTDRRSVFRGNLAINVTLF